MRKLLAPAVLVLVLLVGAAPAEAGPRNTFTFKQGSYSVTEGNTTNPVVQVLITRSSNKGSASVNFSADSGTATPDSGGGCSGPPVDYVKKSNFGVYFNDGQSQIPVVLTTCGDKVYEGNEVVTMRLDAPSAGYGIANKSSVPLTIGENDPVPTISIDNPSADEGMAMGFKIKLSGPTQSGASVKFATADGSATTPEDYSPKNGTITWAPYTNADVARFSQTHDDQKFGLGEAFTMNLSGAVGGTILTPSGTGTINEKNDPPKITINNVTRPEGGTLSFTASLDKVSEAPTMLDWATYDGSAHAGICGIPGDNDYAALSGTGLTIPAGSLSAPLTIDVVSCQDNTPEPNQTFGVQVQ